MNTVKIIIQSHKPELRLFLKTLNLCIIYNMRLPLLPSLRCSAKVMLLVRTLFPINIIICDNVSHIIINELNDLLSLK
jgi:hypothetical protein